jgi:hypothetical protein
MTKEIHGVRQVVLGAATAVAMGFLAEDTAAAMRGVMLDGMTFDSASEMPQSATYSAGKEAFKNFCRNNDRDDLITLYTNLEVAAAGKLAEVGAGFVTDFFPDDAQIDKILDAVEEECDREDEQDNFGLTKIIYSECRMTMDGMTGQLDIKIPVGGDGHMIVFDGNEGAKMNLTQRVQQASAQVGQGWSQDLKWTPGPGQTVERAGYPATSAQFEYTVGMGAGYGSALAASQQAAEGGISTEEYLEAQQGLGQSQALQVLSGMVSNKVTGWGYFSTDVPGIDIVQSFYQNFATSVAPSGELDSFFGGMIMSSVSLLEKGMPLELHTTVETKLMGKTTISGESMSGIYEVELVDLPSDWCTRSFIDESKVTDIDAQVQQAMAGAGGSGGAAGMSAPGLTAEQAAQMNEARGSMTEEQKQALSGLGLDGLIPGLAGNAAGQPAPQAAAGGVADTSSGPSSSELTTDNLTQSVQLHLEALGYSVGNTDGELDTNTVIAISQFQAENGMEVTGAVTPQFLGILGAKIDAP